MKKVLVTGGEGFIGKNIQESFLAEKYRILAPTKQELDLTQEQQVRQFFQENPVDVVIHGAAKPGHRNAPDQINIFYEDMRMFLNLVRNADSYKKMIVLGSGAAYDVKQSLSKVKEEFFDTFVPADEHGFYRYAAAKYMERLPNMVELRIFGIFGKYEDYAIRFISNAICKALFDLPITIKQNRRFDYMYVNDLMPILAHFIENQPAHRAYNVTPDSSIELFALAEKVKVISGKDVPILVKTPGMGLEYSGDNSRLKAEMKDLTLTLLDQAITELYHWYEEHKGSLNKEVLLTDP